MTENANLITDKLQQNSPRPSSWEFENQNRLISVAEDMSKQKSVELLLLEQNRLLKLIASLKPMDECLTAVCDSVSKLNSGVRACILLTDDQRLKFPRSITPNFPPSFGQGLKDAPINELAIGTCGTAVYCGKPVICTDIANDTRWSLGWRDLCVAHGIFACHSTPILGADNLPLGSLMLCFDKARSPTDWEYRLAEFGTQIASIVFEREQSSKALRESEDKYRTLFNSMGEAFALCKIILDDDRKPFDVLILEVNPAHETVTGLTNEETMGNTMRQLIPDFDDSWYETCFRVAKGGETIRFENYVSSLNRWFDIYAYKVGKNDDGKFALIYSDISERKQTETALKQNEERLRLAVEVGRMVAWEWNPHSDTIITTDNFSSIYGLSKIEAAGQGFALVHPEDRARHQSLVENAVATGKGYHSVFRFIRPDNGEIIWLEERGEAWLDEKGNVQKLIGVVIDITERKQAVKALRDSEEFKQRILESSNDCIKVLSLNHEILYMNPGGLCLIEIDDFSSVCNTDWLSFWQGEDREKAKNAIATAKAGQIGHFQGYCPTMKDKPKWWDVVVTPIRDASGEVTQFVAISRDITQQKQVEVLLRESEEKFRNMADNAPVMIWMTDATGYCTYLSRSWYEFSGQTEEIGLGFGWLDAVHPEDSESSKNIFLDANRQKSAFQLEYRLRRSDGKYRTCIDAASPWFGVDGQFKGYIGSVMDITERKQAEESLRRSEERYRTLFESIEDGFCVIEMMFDENNQPIDYRFLEINPAFEKQTGLKDAEGKSIRQLVPNLEAHWFEIYGKVALTGEPIRFENSSQEMNRWFDVYAFRFEQPESRKVAIFFKDITERKQSEIQQQQRAKELTQLNHSLVRTTDLLAERNQELNSFSYIVSHDLKAPLRAISNLSQWIEDDLQEKLDEDNQRQMQLLRNRVERMEAMIDGLLTYSRVGRTEVETQSVKVKELLNEILDSLVIPPTFTISIQAELPTIVTKRLLLSQVFANLISNAIKHHPRPDGQIEISATCKGQFYEFAVSDDGNGIAPENHDKIFGIFQTLNSRDVKESTGIGLSIVKKIVETEGGEITVTSELGSGATFRFTWPKQPLTH
ncbi:hypothetical protein C7H19_09020 [Aphanothece hegewaldii CCALA 016]|uniref:histidine kinase n=1 Tax=Aphanothece hegewaldii CCALA 016 TaxID=2107694 RepID=A0A2T1LZ50_9CHRO|nr:PAS domain S-box protein [Aphanothece hegewaldii]PSF37685.1 hypothetical protein C7H19_09020 [Aphanothece hegewaldii CCALA 016]